MRKHVCAAALAAALCSSAWAGETISYSYDALGRLTGVAHSGTVNSGLHSTITYDAADNRSNYTVTGVGSLSLSIADASVTEGGNLVFTVTRSGTATGTTTVNYATANGTATAGSDYTAASGTLTFAATDTSKTITVATTNDTTVEANETLSVTLSNPSAGVSLSRASATGTIINDDSPPVGFAVGNAAAVTEGGTLVFTVTKTGTTSSSTSVNYATANGTAVAGSDYTATSGTLSFAAGDTSKTISVATINDTVVESAETVLLNLSAPSAGATITTAQGSGTINDNDIVPITPTNPTLSYSSSQAATITIAQLATLNGRSGKITVFNLPSGAGTATIAADGQSISFSAEHMVKPPACEPAETDSFSVPYTILDVAAGTSKTGSATVNVTGPAGGPPPGHGCP